MANKANSGTDGLAAVVVTKNNESPANSKTPESGQPASKKRNASLTNVAPKVAKNTERAKRLDDIISSIIEVGEMGAHEYKLFCFASESMSFFHFGNIFSGANWRLVSIVCFLIRSSSSEVNDAI